MSENRVRILLVEDSPSDARLLCESLEDYPWQAFEIVRAERLEEALALLPDGGVDAILLDLTLPDSSGLETCRRMSEAAAPVPVIILTGAEDERIVAEAMHLGVQDYLVKGQISGGMIGRAIRYAVERSLAQRALRESEEDLNRAQAVAQIGSWRLDLRHNQLLWSAETYRIFGIARGTPMTYEMFLAAVHPEDRAEVDRRWTQALHGTPYDIEHRILVDGRLKWVRGKAELEFDQQGTLRGGFGTVQDITERKHVEEALRRSEERVWATFNNAGVGLAEVERDDHIMAANDRFCQILGYERRDLLGKTIHELTAPEDQVRSDDLNRQLHEGQFARIDYEKRFLRRDGRPLWAHVTVSAIHDAEGRWQRSIGTVEDISERHRAEEALRGLTATLESKVAQRTAELEHRARQLQKLTLELSQTEDRERRRLAEILHDDLQQILAAAKFHLSLLRSRLKHDVALHTAAAQIDQMLKDAIAKSRSLSHELSPAVLYQDDFAATLRWLADQMRTKYGLTVHVHARDPVCLRSDAIKAFLYKTAQELLFNAAKHAQVHEAGLWVRERGGHACLLVSDRGRGFDPRTLREAKGFGLLSIRERTELLGGRMRIRSAAGQGSTFFIAVPKGTEPEDRGRKMEGEKRTAKGAPSSVLRSPSSVLRVLLADDHEIVRQGLVSLLSEEDTVEIVGEATNGREAVDLTEQLRPDVVIMDVSMPVMNGAEAARRIKKDLPQTRIVSLSMWEEPEVRERMYRAGAESYVLKTAPSEELLAAIRGKVVGK